MVHTRRVTVARARPRDSSRADQPVRAGRLRAGLPWKSWPEKSRPRHPRGVGRPVSRRDDDRVADILDAASEIAEIIELGVDAWDKDRIRRLAVERLLEIIGEAANSLSDDFRAQHSRVPWRDIIGLRVVLAHHYHLPPSRPEPGVGNRRHRSSRARFSMAGAMSNRGSRRLPTI
jgi:uncharacterized protein with HEPN domain